MAILKFEAKTSEPLAGFLQGFSVEVMPRTAAKIENFRAILPADTRVYIAHIDGTPIDDMMATAKRLTDDGFPVMPHFPARFIKDRAMLENWIERYADFGIDQALLLAGGRDNPSGDFSDSMQMMETGLFDQHGFKRIHVAGHPEGNKDIADVSAALRWKSDFQSRTDAKMAIATQFCFEAEPVIKWANHIQAEGITLPVHIGVAGPAKLQTLIKFSMACGIGASLRVLTRRAKDITKLMMPFEPTEFLSDLAAYKLENPNFPIETAHFFPLGGIKATAKYLGESTHIAASA